MSKITDSSQMPFGKYQGMAMINVPADYLMWLYDNNKCNSEVRVYIVENLDVLKKEINDKQKNDETRYYHRH
ncbi:MAG: DUF3820 family protein [Candidatus Azobacteroides sp.]|nr:DUF3820 family protein [Candidatus Azobacteroides sp.]